MCCEEGGKGAEGRAESLKEENLFSNENWNTHKEFKKCPQRIFKTFLNISTGAIEPLRGHKNSVGSKNNIITMVVVLLNSIPDYK